ncbi:GNAT family N-acetyltransferase [Marivirga tractuosa]|uniref:GNAT family N-acetyltransferase n=1 Tax=Marivirga tractuosa TaxID=1006 RepID=UPI0035CE9282
MSGIQIKQITLQEITDLQKISKETFFETYAAGNTEEDMKRYLEEEFASDKLISELKDQNSEFYFALFENKIVGYLKINFGHSQTDIHDENSLEIQRIYVLKQYQGKRIGKLLYQKALEIAKQKKLDYLWLGVWEENPKAIQFYEKVGFVAFDKHVFKLGE